MLNLLLSRRLLPLLGAQSIGAFADNMVKNALAVIALLTLAHGNREAVPLAGGIFMLPFLLFSATAGKVAANFAKSRSLAVIKLIELCILTAAAAAIMAQNVPALFVVLFALGLDATFLSPIKYAIVPELLPRENLVAGNGIMEAGTFAGILLGTLAGGALAASGHYDALAGLAVGAGVVGWVATLWIPHTPRSAAPVAWRLNILVETTALIDDARQNRRVWLAILGLSWFWTIGAVLIAEFPEIGEHITPGGQAISWLLAAFTLGVGFGSLICNTLIKGDPIARYAPFLCLAMSLFGWDTATAAAQLPYDAADLTGYFAFWRMMADLFLLATAGGLFSVPLYTLLQTLPARQNVARMIAANNVVNAGYMVAGAGVAAFLAFAGATPIGIMRVVAIANLGVFFVMIRLLPRDTLHVIFRLYLRLGHRIEVRGLEHVRDLTQPVVYVSNHQSYADGALLAAYLPGHPQFAVNSFIMRKWWARPFMMLVDVFPVDPSRPHAINAMVKSVKAGRSLVIFPEGRLTRTGALMKVYDGSAMVADKAEALIVPVRIDGPHLTPLSTMGKYLRLRWFSRLRITVLPPRALAVDPALDARARRHALGEALQDLMTEAQFATRRIDRSLFAGLLDMRDDLGGGHEIADDPDFRPINYGKLVLGSALLGRRLNKLAPHGPMGVLLPNSVGALVSFMALQAFGRVPVMLNFSQGPAAMLATCRIAGVETVITSRRFADRANLTEAIGQIEAELRVLWLEDVRAGLGVFAKLRALVDARRARHLPGARIEPNETALILTTSGSTGVPKAVLLSHRNLLANIEQTAAAIDFNPSDRVVNALPMFHSFGLTCGTLLPMMLGIRIFFYPSPLHFREVPEMIYDQDTTIVFGTDTFLTGWARYAHPYDFRAVRFAIAGAEKIRDETRKLFAERFGVRLLEAYGATETSPGIACNTTMRCVPGTVGRLMVGIESRVVPAPGITEGGVLHIRGPNVMRGYIDATKPGGIDAPEDGWYDTGDVVKIEPGGFVRILGRVKRFAKIGGERISMDAAELLAQAVWPDATHAVIAMPDARKGEVMALLTTEPTADLGALLAHARGNGIGEITVPRQILRVPAIPVLGTGKTNYPAALELAQRLLGILPDAAGEIVAA